MGGSRSTVFRFGAPVIGGVIFKGKAITLEYVNQVAEDEEEVTAIVRLHVDRSPVFSFFSVLWSVSFPVQVVSLSLLTRIPQWPNDL